MSHQKWDGIEELKPTHGGSAVGCVMLMMALMIGFIIGVIAARFITWAWF